jgi:hypothetical protein
LQLGRTGVGQADQLLAPVLPRPGGDPAGGDQGAKVAGQRRLVEGRKPAEIPPAYFPRGAQALQERVLGRAQADLV